MPGTRPGMTIVKWGNSLATITSGKTKRIGYALISGSPRACFEGLFHCQISNVMPYFVYILASRKNGTLYTGVTNDISRRAWEHKEGAVDGFTKRYSVKRLVYLEELATAYEAIRRENTIKGWPRKWKINAIERENPQWFDLYKRLNR